MTPALPAGCVIALLGAPGTGKTRLAHLLTERLAQRGVVAVRIDDGHAAWLDREPGRSPTAQALAAIAREQTLRIAAAAERAVVVADTTALALAVRADVDAADPSLYDEAMAAHRRYAITLLMAQDLPSPGSGSGSAQVEAIDAALRAALTRAHNPFAVIHGQGPERLASAWTAIQSSAEAGGGDQRTDERPWFWPCDKCSDPACEHRLFSDLVARRK